MQKKSNGPWIQWLALLTFLGMITVNALANILPLNGISTGEISDSYPNLFAPAAPTFAIWGLIYLLLALYTLYLLGLFRGRKPANETLLRRTGLVFIVINLLNAAWIFSWHYELIPLSMLLMVLLLLCLIDITLIIRAQKPVGREKFFVRLPFSVYFGWITVATIANATVLLVSLGWNGFGLSESFWTILVLAVGVLIGAVTTLRLKDAAYGLVLVWAYTGILYKHISPGGFDGQYPGVIAAAGIGILLFAAAVIYVLAKKR
jgi:hypothetical protein